MDPTDPDPEHCPQLYLPIICHLPDPPSFSLQTTFKRVEDQFYFNAPGSGSAIRIRIQGAKRAKSMRIHADPDPKHWAEVFPARKSLISDIPGF